MMPLTLKCVFTLYIDVTFLLLFLRDFVPTSLIWPICKIHGPTTVDSAGGSGGSIHFEGNVSVPSYFIANVHNDLWSFYTGKGDLLKNNSGAIRGRPRFESATSGCMATGFPEGGRSPIKFLKARTATGLIASV